MRKSVWLLVIVIVVFSAGVWLRIRQLKTLKEMSPIQEEKEEITAVEVTKPVEKRIDLILSYTGSIKGENQVQVFSEVPGKLKEYKVREGDEVKEGQVIALIDRGVTGMEYNLARVESPINGVVASLPLDIGAAVAPQIPVAVIVNMNRIHAVFEAGEKDIGKLREGKKVIVRVDAYPSITFPGTLAQISPVLNPYSHTVTCRAIIPNPQRKLKPGMYARIDVKVDSYFYNFALPEQALIEDAEKGKYYVFVAVDTRAEKKEVETGLRANGFVGIKSGLKKDEEVIVEGKEYLKDGQKIRIIKETKSQEEL